METNKFSGFTKLYPLSKTLSLEDVCVYSATLISTIVDIHLFYICVRSL